MKKSKYANICGILLYVITGMMLLYSVYLSSSSDIWYDELFSMEFAQRKVTEMIKLTAADVHPPLYYIIVHFAILLGNIFSLSAVNMAKLASVIPFFVLMIYGIFPIRKRYGVMAGGLFSFAMVAMPNMSEYTVEIRMYGYAILFVTAMCIHAKVFLENERDKQIKGLDWKAVFPVFIYGLCACYTQYYAAIAVFSVYLFLIIWTVRRNMLQLGILLISVNATVVLFFPWATIVISQVGEVSENYWIQELTWRSLGGVVKYITRAAFTNNAVAVILAVVLFVLLTLQVFGNLKKAYMWMCFFPIIGIVLLGFAASIIIRPFFVYRYMLPGLGAFWLGIIVAIFDGPFCFEETAGTSEIEKMKSPLIQKFQKNALFRIVPVALVALMIIIGIRDYFAFRGNELYRRVNMEKTQELFEELLSEEDLVIISNFDQVDALIAYYLNRNKSFSEGAEKSKEQVRVLLYGYEPEALISKMVPGVGYIENGDDVKALIEEGKKVLFLGSFNSREDIVKGWYDSQGIDSENKGSYLMERYWFDVFELSLHEDSH